MYLELCDAGHALTKVGGGPQFVVLKVTYKKLVLIRPS